MPIPFLVAGASRLAQMCSSKALTKSLPMPGGGPRGLNSLLDAGGGGAGKSSPMDMLGNVADLASLTSMFQGGGGGGHDKPKSTGTTEMGQ